MGCCNWNTIREKGVDHVLYLQNHVTFVALNVDISARHFAGVRQNKNEQI